MIHSAELVADFTSGDGSADVRIQYRFSLDTEGDVTLELLGFADASASAFEIAGTGTATRLETASGSRKTASVSVSAAPGGGERLLTLTYRIERAVDDDDGALHGRVPVLSLALPPVDAVSDVFKAHMRLPPTWAVSEGFPTGLRRADDGSYAVSLPVVPALLSVRARTDGRWRPGLPLALDLLAALVLIAYGYRGGRHLREVAR